MKKIISMLVALMLAVSACCCAFAEEPLAGGWALSADGTMTDEAKEAFAKAIGDLDNVKPIALLGTQVVAGINYSILVLNDYGRDSYFSVLTIYADLQGNATVESESLIKLGIQYGEEAEDGQNPVMNFIGEYQDKVSQRAVMTISCVGAHGALVEISWANSAADGVKWTLNCDFDSETGIFTYTEGVRKEYTCDENGELTYGEIQQELKGTLTAQEDGTITWEAEGADADNGCIFEFCPAAPQE